MTGSFSTRQCVTKPAVQSRGGVVAAQHRTAAEIGAAILAEGGDAMDAAVAVSFAIGVLEPWMSGPAGGGAMVLYRADEDRVRVVDFGMRAPMALDPADYPLSGAGVASDLFPWPQVVDNRNVQGGPAVAVPGVVAGVALAHEAYGRMPWADLLQPAIAEAEAGLLLDWYASLIIASAARSLAQDAGAAAAFLEDGQWPPVFGWTAMTEKRLDQSAMAASLRQLAHAGAGDFYRGDLAAALAADVQAIGGALALGDLRAYEARWAEPLLIPYRGARVFAAPELTAGPTLARVLEALAGHAPPPTLESPALYARYADTIRSAQAERLTYMGDVEKGRGLPGCTTHFSIVDRHGNMAAVTQTLLSIFGAKAVSPNTGLLLNNGVMWFDPEPGGPNALGPGKRCLMNVCPVIGEADGARFALGAAGGRKILSAVTQIVSALVDGAGDLDAAFHRPRIDASGATVIVDSALPEEVSAAIAAAHPVKRQPRLPFPFHFACPSGVLRREGVNSGAVEMHSPWGDAAAEPA